MPTTYDVVVVGAGQAGLATGYHLARRGLRFCIVDAGTTIGHAWKSRWDSLRLFTPAEYDSLPGLPFPAPAGTHPTKDEVAAYLQSYARHFDLPVCLNTRVERVARAEGEYVVETSNGDLHANRVVVATGPFQLPRIPESAAGLEPAVLQLHSSTYRNPSQLLRDSRVLVVGAANSGLQIADELSGDHEVTLAVGSSPPQLPQRLLGQDLFFWLDRLGVLTKPAHSRLARRMRSRGDLVIGSSTRGLARRDVDIRPRLDRTAGRIAYFSDGTSTEIDAVVWATGYRPDYSWLDVDGVVGPDGSIRHDGGVTASPGLYSIGLPWLTCRGSALLGFVGRDAERISDAICAVPLDDSPVVAARLAATDLPFQDAPIGA